MEQGRLAVCHAFGAPTCTIPELFPYGIYAIPEISMVGKTEDQLTEAGIPYEAGIAQYKELARGQLLGDDTGMLKLLIHQETHQILGVHAIGTNATELIHIGQAVMAFNGTVDYFINNVFNFPTLAEAYKVAAARHLVQMRRGDLLRAGDRRSCRHLQRRGREHANDRSGGHVQRRRGQRADANSSGHVYSCHRGDLLRSGGH